jgi:hypothetical protein
MATRVAELLSTMTTPTAEIVFPPTATPGLPTIAPTATQQPGPTMPIAENPTVSFTATATATSTPVVATTMPTAMNPTVSYTPTVTATAPATDPANKLGNPTGSDPMDSYQKWAWPTDSDAFLNVVFKDGFMQMTGLTSYAGWRLPLVSQQTNSYIELTVNTAACAEKDSYGIIFRIPVFKEPVQGYLYQVTCDGYYRLWKWDGKVQPNGFATSLINWKQSTAINTGPNQTNRLGVMVVGNRIILYMNGTLLGETNDTSFPAGFFGVFVRSSRTEKYTVNFDMMKYWENPAP